VSAIDTHPAAGYLAAGRYGEVVTRYVAPSLDVLDQLGTVDLFLHDSLRSREYETAEIDLIAPRLTERAVVLSNTGDVSAGLPAWAERTGRTFAYFQERPAGHWYPGGGIAVAFPGRHGTEQRPVKARASRRPTRSLLPPPARSRASPPRTIRLRGRGVCASGLQPGLAKASPLAAEYRLPLSGSVLVRISRSLTPDGASSTSARSVVIDPGRSLISPRPKALTGLASRSLPGGGFAGVGSWYFSPAALQLYVMPAAG
jgi:hypothetical protein